MNHLTPTPVLYHVSRALSRAFARGIVCNCVLCSVLFAWGESCCDVQLSVVVTGVCWEGRKWGD